MASKAAAKVPSWLVPLKRWAYHLSGFHKFGLRHDDVLDSEEDEVVQEALRRLPEHLLQARNFRIIRALQAGIEHDILPKEQWTVYENDERYLKPYLEQVRKEFAERDEWENEH